MDHPETALYTVAAATAFGLLAQLVGHRWRIPPIVPLLAFGVAIGPSGLGWVQPGALGGGLGIIVKLAVAIILFEGALNLRLADLHRSAREVRNLVTTGVLISWAGATLASRYVARLPWMLAIVFGALMTVTGPTVVQPLLKRVEIPRRVRVILEGEAILIDPIGAILAVAVLDILLGLAGERSFGLVEGIWSYAGRLLVGLLVGGGGALLLSRALRTPRLVPAELVSLVALGAAWAVFALAERLLPEAGIMAAVALGLVLQRGVIPEERRMRQFKEQLTVLGISLLFILLAANLPLSVIAAEGWRGPLTALTLMLVVRPLAVFGSLRGTETPMRERLFIAWIGPRGVVAASVASVFALSLAQAGRPDGQRILALTFLTIAITVLVQGLTANRAARLLGLQSMAGKRAIVVGAGPVGRAVARRLRDGGRPVVVLDRNPELVALARGEGLDATVGNALEEGVLEQAGADDAETIVATTTNAEVNVLAAQLGHEAFGIVHAFPALASPERGANRDLLSRAGGHTAFGTPLDVRAWDDAVTHGEARELEVELPAGWGPRTVAEVALDGAVVPLTRARQGSIAVVHPQQAWAGGDHITFLARGAASEEAVRTLLDERGTRSAPGEPRPARRRAR
jgi:NhaP-type Na+/H+ or K+/H+ antiporter